MRISCVRLHNLLSLRHDVQGACEQAINGHERADKSSGTFADTEGRAEEVDGKVREQLRRHKDADGPEWEADLASNSEQVVSLAPQRAFVCAFFPLQQKLTGCV